MADKKAKAAAKPDAGGKKKKKGGTIGFLFIMILVGASMWSVYPTYVLLLFGMLPTVVALMTDNDKQKSSVISVGAMNAAGVTPFVIDLWTKGQTMGNVFQILRDPMNWLVILGSAAVGQLILFAVPQAVASLSLARSEARLKVLRQNLESLKESWGPDVGTTKPVEQVGRGL